MAKQETTFRVIGRLTVDYQIIIQAKDADEAEYFASDLELDKWNQTSSDWEILDISRDYFLRQIKVEQVEFAESKRFPRIVRGDE